MLMLRLCFVISNANRGLISNESRHILHVLLIVLISFYFLFLASFFQRARTRKGLHFVFFAFVWVCVCVCVCSRRLGRLDMVEWSVVPRFWDWCVGVKLVYLLEK